jgi:hypothetical protein
MVRGLYIKDLHHVYLSDRSCLEGELTLRRLLNGHNDHRAKWLLAQAARKDPRVRLAVVYSGTLSSEVHIGTCKEPSCYYYFLDKARLLGASEGR